MTLNSSNRELNEKYFLLIYAYSVFRKTEKIESTAEQSTTDHPHTVVMRQCLVLQCDVLPSSVANATLHMLTNLSSVGGGGLSKVN